MARGRSASNPASRIHICGARCFGHRGKRMLVRARATANDSPDTVMGSRTLVTHRNLVDGLNTLGLSGVEIVVVHSSLSAFGWVAAGPPTVIAALRSMVPTVLVPAFTYDSVLPSPPDSDIPFNGDAPAATWEEFQQALARTPPHRIDGPIDRNMGAVAAALAAELDASRSPAPICGFSGVGPRAPELLAHGTAEHPLGVVEAAAGQGGRILLLGVGHESNTTIHVAENLEQRGGFTRYAPSPKIHPAGRPSMLSAVRHQAFRRSNRTWPVFSVRPRSAPRDAWPCRPRTRSEWREP